METKRITAFFNLAVLLVTQSLAQTPITNNGIGSTPIQRHAISLSQAQTVLTAAEAAAKSSVPVNIAVVDQSGLLVAFARMDNAFPGCVEISQMKARVSVLFNGVSTGQLAQAFGTSGASYGLLETNGGLVAIGGGLPLYLDGHLVGAVGVSGASTTQDTAVAQAGVDAFLKAYANTE